MEKALAATKLASLFEFELELSQDPEKLAKRRTEKKERSAVLKEKIIKMIESGLQLSEYQARKAFTVYLQCILQVE